MTWLDSPFDSSDASGQRPGGPVRAFAVIEVDVGPDTITVMLTGELDVTTRPVLTERLLPILATKPRRLVLDMAGTDFMDCGSARLIASARWWLPDDARLVVRRPSRAVRRVLELTGLDAYYEIEG
jgi:anti-sigma B factor antagonist